MYSITKYLLPQLVLWSVPLHAKTESPKCRIELGYKLIGDDTYKFVYAESELPQTTVGKLKIECNSFPTPTAANIACNYRWDGGILNTVVAKGETLFTNQVTKAKEFGAQLSIGVGNVMVTPAGYCPRQKLKD